MSESERDQLKRKEKNEKRRKRDSWLHHEKRWLFGVENTQTLKTASDRVPMVPRNSLKYPDAIGSILYCIYLIVVLIQALSNLSILPFSPKTGRYISQIMRCVETDQVVR